MVLSSSPSASHHVLGPYAHSRPSFLLLDCAYWFIDCSCWCEVWLLGAAVACSCTAAWVPLCQFIPSSRNSTLMDARWVEPAEGCVSLSQHPRSLVITIFWGLVANFHGAPEHSERQRAGTGGTYPSSALGDKKSRKGQAGVNCITITSNSYSVVLSIHADRNKPFNYTVV